jgi:hypothetical protein
MAGMPRFVAIAVLVLAACSTQDEASPPAPAADLQGWRLASGKAPSRAEYVAIVAACQDGAVRRAQGKPLDGCLADLGLRHGE